MVNSYMRQLCCSSSDFHVISSMLILVNVSHDAVLNIVCMYRELFTVIANRQLLACCTVPG